MDRPKENLSKTNQSAVAGAEEGKNEGEVTGRYARIAPGDIVSASSNQLIEPRDGMYLVQGVFEYTD